MLKYNKFYSLEAKVENKDDRILKIISNETKDSIESISVVTPSIYASIFSKYASDHDTDISDEKGLSHDLIAKECSTLTDLQDKTSKNITKLSQHTSKAIDAIQNNNEAALKETDSLRQEILKLKQAVYKDELTHVFNRKWLNDNLLEEDNFSNSGVLAIIDLNYFKQINDTHGHVIGDKVLIFIANQLKQMKENIIRYGGDEFIIIFPSKTKVEDALSKLKNLRNKIVTKKLKAGTAEFRVSFSIGAHAYKKGDSLSTTIELADKNLYEDKIDIKKTITGI
jgi:diguanylate cyclase (GGDEF)-like protein